LGPAKIVVFPATTQGAKVENREHASGLLSLLEFDQGSGKIFGTQKKDWLAMCPNCRASITEDARACPFQLLARRKNVGDLEAEMMNRPARIFSQEIGDWGMLAERFDQLDLGVFELDESHCHAMSWQGQGPAHPGAERVAIDRARGHKVSDRDGDMIQSSDHANCSRMRSHLDDQNVDRGPLAPYP
jgi:hypothetical protein